MTLDEIIIGLNNRLKELERRTQNAKRTGTIHSVDAEKGLARVLLMPQGSNGKPFLSPWLPWAEQAAGQGKTHFPVSVGQQVHITSESGDLTDGTIEMSVPSNQNARPSQSGTEFVLLDNGGVRISADGGALRITASSFRLDASASAEISSARTEVDSNDIRLEGSTLRHNGKSIGDSHTHTGVETGNGTTGEPS